MINDIIAHSSIYLKFFIALFAVINPIGVLPLFSNMVEGLNKQEELKIRKTTTLSIIIILLTGLLVGQMILNFFSISLNSFRIVGGILICNIAFTMISGKLTEEKQNNEEKKDLSNITNFAIVPLAIPILAGPGAISTTIVWGAKYSNLIDIIGLGCAILCFGALCYILFTSSTKFVKILGKTGSNVVTRLMGLILMALGVEILTTGIVEFYLINLKPIL